MHLFRLPFADDDIDFLVGKLGAENKAALSRMFEPIKLLLATEDNLEAVQEKLPGLYGLKDDGDFKRNLALAMSACELMGRYDIEQGN